MKLQELVSVLVDTVSTNIENGRANFNGENCVNRVVTDVQRRSIPILSLFVLVLGSR